MSEPRRVRVLVVDDSQAFRTALALTLRRDPELEVVAEACDGQEAIHLVEVHRPDVVTMDVVMPRLDGLEAARAIMATQPTPIVLMSTLASTAEQRLAFNAMRLGVVDVVNKPVLSGAGAADRFEALCRMIKAAAAVRLRSARRAQPPRRPVRRSIGVVAIAASTGGPPAIEAILRSLPLDAPPVLVAQHLAPSFGRGLASWLSQCVPLKVHVVDRPTALARGCVYLAEEGCHLVHVAGAADSVAAGEGELRPSADRLFRSLVPVARSTVAVVLTGMGHDGAAGLRALHDAGATTLAQDPESAAVYGMPAAAIAAGGASEVASLEALGPRIAALVEGFEARNDR